jgi:hypothetical protein
MAIPPTGSRDNILVDHDRRRHNRGRKSGDTSMALLTDKSALITGAIFIRRCPVTGELK